MCKLLFMYKWRTVHESNTVRCLTLSREHKHGLKVSGPTVIRRISTLVRGMFAGGWRKIHNGQFHNLNLCQMLYISWLQIQRSGSDSRRYQISWEVACLERGPLSLVSTIEELLERKNSGSGLESREYSCRDLSGWPRCNLHPQIWH
jgi:hypothetical protein